MISGSRATLAVAGILLAGASVGCGKKTPSDTPTPQGAVLAGLLAQPILLTPTQRARVAPELGWTTPRAAELTAALDSAIVKRFRERDIGRGWFMGEALVQSYLRNSTYATDPRTLSVDVLRSAVQIGTRLPEPLASQLRTMIALHDGRLVLIPVELRVERADSAQGRGTVRLVLIDPRASDVRWVGEVKGDGGTAFAPSIIESAATKFANLFLAPTSDEHY
jgi:hypothetical protein